MTVRYYPAVIERADGGFGVFFPDLPGRTSFGATLQDAARNAEEGLQGHLDVTAEHGDLIPEPSDLDLVPIQDGVDEAARVPVRAEMPGRAVQVNIDLPEDLLNAVDRYAAANGCSRSGLLAQAIRDKLRA